MNEEILVHLQGVTAEEQAILDGRTTIDRDIYMQGQSNTINAKKLLAAQDVQWQGYVVKHQNLRECKTYLFMRQKGYLK